MPLVYLVPYVPYEGLGRHEYFVPFMQLARHDYLVHKCLVNLRYLFLVLATHAPPSLCPQCCKLLIHPCCPKSAPPSVFPISKMAFPDLRVNLDKNPAYPPDSQFMLMTSPRYSRDTCPSPPPPAFRGDCSLLLPSTPGHSVLLHAACQRDLSQTSVGLCHCLA